MSKSKIWIMTILAVLLIGGGGWIEPIKQSHKRVV